jgi:hypothetical protein
MDVVQSGLLVRAQVKNKRAQPFPSKPRGREYWIVKDPKNKRKKLLLLGSSQTLVTKKM